MRTYHVVVLDKSGGVEQDHTLTAASAEDAVSKMVPEQVFRGEKGVSRWVRAKVYFSGTAATTLIRFYAKH